jgi:hypothetical protein
MVERKISLNRNTHSWNSASPEAWRIRVTNAPKRARDTRAADPMANPFPMAAVVLPAESRASVFSRT